MWFKQLMLALSLVSTVMSFGGLDEGLYNLEREDQVQVVEIEIVEEPVEEEIKEVKEIKEITKFQAQGLILKEGVASEEVLRVKKFFVDKGYTNIEENYYFDSRTREVVMDYQKNNGLSPDGAIGVNTYNKINEDIDLHGINIPEIDLRFTGETPVEGWIIINKSNNTLYHLSGTRVVNKYPVATGKLPEYTPEGKFTIVTKFINPAWGGAGRHSPVKGGAPNNPLGKRWMGLNIKGGGVYGVHGNSDVNSIGKYISLGCVRMYNEDVEYLYEYIDMGTPVWIGQQPVLQSYGVFFEINLP